MLRVLAQQHDTRSRLRAHFVERGTALELSKEQALNLYRIVQGAVSNVTRHSGAGRMDIELDWHADWLQITIADNGIGLENDRRRWREKGIGLSTMQHRAAVIGAGLKIEAPSQGGTRVMLTLQLTPAGAA